ncbi:MAG: SnoaL-like polyketide cyclase [Nannocystales bacterium]
MKTPEQLLLKGRDAVVAATDEADWRKGKAPDYHYSNERMPGQRTTNHAEGSLEAIVESLIQVFEMEISHKPDANKWLSVVKESFKTRVNGGQWYNADALAERGSYNVLIGETPFYDSEAESFESSHDIFHQALPGGFFWEVLDVISPPPVVTFKWRHWGDFTGPYKGFEPTGERVEMFGVSIAKVTDNLQIVDVEHFYDNSQFLGKLTGGCPIAGHMP